MRCLRFATRASPELVQDSRASSAFWKRLACERSALASVSNQSAISSKPSSRAYLAMPGYMSVYSWVSPAMAAFRLSARVADRQAGRGIAHSLEIFQVTMCVAGLTFRGGTEHGRHIV